MNIRYRKQLFICSGKSCSERHDPEAAKKYFKQAIKDAGLKDEIRACTCSCLDYCDDGPNLVLYPEGKLFQEVKPENWPEILEELKKP
jgi:NADP-reducing hydrogenase subunit HndC